MRGHRNERENEVEEIGGEVIRVRIPKRKNREVLGIVERMLGANKIMVQCLDGVERICRIPGRLKKKEWIAIGNVVIVVPWDFQDEKADVIHKYTRAEETWLEKKGYLK